MAEESEKDEFCSICGAAAKSTHLNYGSSCSCLSCRAFFRRTLLTLAKGTRNFHCSDLGRCPVNVKTRRKCQMCRYDRCLKAGMRPELVMDLSAKKRRFRRPDMWDEADGTLKFSRNNSLGQYLDSTTNYFRPKNAFITRVRG